MYLNFPFFWIEEAIKTFSRKKVYVKINGENYNLNVESLDDTMVDKE